MSEMPSVESDAGIWTLCPDCPHVRHSRPCAHQVRGMEDVYRDCGCVTSPAEPPRVEGSGA